MKKALLIPALAIIATSLSGCSILSWYKNQNKKSKTSELVFNVNAADNLTFALTPGYGMEKKSEDIVRVQDNYGFEAASFAHDDKLFTIQSNDSTNFLVKDYREVNNFRRNDNYFYYMSFDIDFSSTKENMIVAFDGSNGLSLVEGDIDETVLRSVRVAFINEQQAQKPVIWAPNRNHNECTYQIGENLYKYSDDDKLIAQDDIQQGTYEWQSLDDKMANKNAIGYFTGSEMDVRITIIVWLEGSDPTLVNENSLRKFVASFKLTFSLQ